MSDDRTHRDHSAAIDLVQAWERAWNARDPDRLLELAAPDFELVRPGGAINGRAELRETVWRQTFGVALTVMSSRFFVRGTTVVAAGRTELRFVDTNELATADDATAITYAIDRGRVVRVEPHSDLAAALDSAGLWPQGRGPGSGPIVVLDERFGERVAR